MDGRMHPSSHNGAVSMNGRCVRTDGQSRENNLSGRKDMAPFRLVLRSSESIKCVVKRARTDATRTRSYDAL